MATSVQNPSATILKHSSETWELKVDRLDPQSLPERCYVFLDKKSYPDRESDLKKPHPQRESDRERDRKYLLQHFKVPDFLYNDTCTESNGYFGCKRIYNKEGKLESYSTWFRCLVKMVSQVTTKASRGEEPEYTKAGGKSYIWFEMGFFTRWDYPGRCTVLCIDTPIDLPKKLQSKLLQEQPPLNFSDPFVMHAPLIDQIILLYDVSVWRVRDPVRDIEKNRERRLRPDFEVMHENSRHATHVSEVLSVTIETMEGIQGQQKAIHESLSSGLATPYQEQAQEYMSFQLQMVKGLKERSLSNHARLQNEITLVYNIMAQEDNKVVKSITLLTMTFLPATFISAFFSTTFFTFGDDGLKASKQMWVYWVVTIPSTLLVLVFWSLFTFPSSKKFFERRSLAEPKKTTTTGLASV